MKQKFLVAQFVLPKRIRIAGSLSLLFLFALIFIGINPSVNDRTNAATSPVLSETTLQISTSDVEVALSVDNPAGTFGVSEPSVVSVGTNNYTGYTLSIAAKEDNENSSKLINLEGGAINSISSIIPSDDAEDDFDIGSWGYLPSKYNSAANTNYLPAPSYVGDVLDVTNAANVSEGNEYTISVATKVGYSVPAGFYSNSFVLVAIANPTTYSVTYDKNTTAAASGVPETQYGSTSDTEINISSATPTRAGYSFTGWCDSTTSTSSYVDSCNGNTYAAGDPIRLDQTIMNEFNLKAMWSVVTYGISYSLGGGSQTSPKTTYTYEDSNFTLVNPTRAGYTFTGWTGTGLSSVTKTVTVSKGSTGDRSYTANWSLDTYSISYTLNSGTASGNPSSYNVNTASFTLNNPTRTGYTFKGWSGTGLSGTTNTSVTVAKGSTGDRSYTANWTANTYTVTLKPNGGSGGSSSVTATYDSAMPSMTRPTRNGYTFAGYYDTSSSSGGTQYYKADGSSARKYTLTSGTTLYARWTKDTYSINYNTDGGCFTYVSGVGCNGNDSSSLPTSLKQYSVDSSVVTLKVPYRSNYLFGGWQEYSSSSYSTKVGSPALLKTIATGSTGNKYYKAVWYSSSATPTVTPYSSGSVTVASDNENGWTVTQAAGTTGWGRAQITDSVTTSWGNTLAVEFRLWIGASSGTYTGVIDPNMVPTSGTYSDNDYYYGGWVFVDGEKPSSPSSVSLEVGKWHIIQIYAANNNTSKNSAHTALKNFHVFGLDLSNKAAIQYTMRELKLCNITGWNG